MKKSILLATCISVLALFLRTYMAYNSPIEPDEPGYSNTAAAYNLAMRQGDWNQILDSRAIIEHPQFFKLIYALGLMPGKSISNTDDMVVGARIQSVPYWHKLFFLRMISVFFGTAAVFLVSLINPLAGLFLAVDTFAVKYTSIIYIEALPAFTSIVALLAALQCLKAYPQDPKNWKKWGGWLLLSSLALGMTAAGKYIYSLVGIAIIITVLIQGWRHKLPSLLGLAAWGLLAVAFFFMLDPVLWHSPRDTLSYSILFNYQYSVGRPVQAVGYPWWQPIQWLMISIPQQLTRSGQAFFINPGDFFILADSLIFILALAGLFSLFKKNWPMAIWLVVGLAFLLAWQTKWPQYILVVLVPFCLAAAYGVEWIRAAANRLRIRYELD